MGDFVIFTRDADFIDIANLRGAPPKILLLRAGNLSTSALHALVLPLVGDLAQALEGSRLDVVIEAQGEGLRPL